MKIRTLILFMAVLLILSSCAKRKAQKIIEGSWSEVIIDGVDVPEAAQDILKIDACEKGDCLLTVTDASGFVTLSTFYELDEKGTELVIITLAGNLTAKQGYSILELTETTMKIDWKTYIGEYTKN